MRRGYQGFGAATVDPSPSGTKIFNPISLIPIGLYL